MATQFWARIDSGTANNPSLNLTVDDAILIEFVNEDILGNPGDFLIDDDAANGRDDDTVVRIDGDEYEFTFELSGTLPTAANKGAGQVPLEFRGQEVYVLTVHGYPGGDIRIVFLPNYEPSPDFADMEAFGNGRIDPSGQSTTPDDDDYVCFASGTRIETADAAVHVEDIRVGDEVLSITGAPLKVVWTGASQLSWPGADEKSRPYEIKRGALGEGKPTRDLVVSPQHRILMRGAAVSDLFGADEVLAPVKGLSELPGVRRMNGKRQVTYVHLLLERHAVIVSEGAATESLYPGPMARKMLGKSDWAELSALFPGLAADPSAAYGAHARPCITRRQAERLVARMAELSAQPLPA